MIYKLFILIDFISLIIIYFTYLYKKWRISNKQLFLKTILYVYLVMVLYFTLLPVIIPIPFINTNYSYFNINLIPFVDINLNHGGAYREVILNVIMMIPFGVLVPYIYRKGFISTAFYTLIFSLSIELMQLISVRKINSTDITDLITNITGGIIGYFIYLIFHKIIDRILDTIFKNNTKGVNYFSLNRVYIKIIIIQLVLRSILINYI